MFDKLLLLLILTNSCGQSVQGVKTPLFPGSANGATSGNVKGSTVETKASEPVVIAPIVKLKSYNDVEPLLKEYCVTGCHMPGSSTLGGKKIYFDSPANITATFKVYAPDVVANTISSLRMPPKNVKRSDDMTTKQREDVVGWLKVGVDIETFKLVKTLK